MGLRNTQVPISSRGTRRTCFPSDFEPLLYYRLCGSLHGKVVDTFAVVSGGCHDLCDPTTWVSTHT